MENVTQEMSLSRSADYGSFSVPSSAGSSPRSPPKLLDNLFKEEGQRKSSFTTPKQNDIVLGQLSYAPATQTTVVTTTTTTTTTFPPFMMKVPTKDPKLYPLAASPTPASIKRFQFKVAGQPAVFQEADDTETTLRNLQQQQKSLIASSGRIRETSTSASENPPLSGFWPPSSSTRRTLSNNKTKVPRFTTTNPRNPLQSSTKTRSSLMQNAQTSTPFTPSLDSRSSMDAFQNTQISSSGAVITPEMEDTEFTPASSQRDAHLKMERTPARGVSTPLSQSAQTPSARDIINRRSSSSRNRPSILDTTTIQDASLPSPSLSPVTAAANLQSKKEYFSESQHSSPFLEDSSQLEDSILGRSMQFSTPSDRQPSIHDIPVMLDAFESMPDEMKNYYMYQILRRCPKSVLHFVVATVNPALKRDFLGELPPELAQNIIKHLDLKSLCRASQVSKQWRKIVDTDEKVWKDLFDAEGFCLSPTELHRSIVEGWGWQSDSRPEGRELDLNTTVQLKTSPTRPTSGRVLKWEVPEEDSNPKGLKRKAGNQAPRPPSRKQRKQKADSIKEFAEFDMDAFDKHVASIGSPYAAAEAASAYVPTSNVGIPSLNVLHLQKSLYRRHHLFSQAWTSKEIEPRHLAFKAHNHNVVTCLQFDSDRIVTGSDDTNINVYDTRSGRLLAKLGGHDGGVWALQYVGNVLVSGSTDRSVRIWDMEEGRCTHTFLGHTSTVRCLIILMPTVIGRTASGAPITMPREPLIITGSRDSTLRVWLLPKAGDPGYNPENVDDQDCPYLVRTLSGHGHSVRAIAAHGDTLVSGSYDYTVRVWKISTGETLHRLVGHGQKVYSVVLDHENKRCISGSMDNMVKVWSLETGNLLYNLEGHSSLVGLLDLQAGRLVSAAADSNLRIWDLDSGVCVKNLVGHNGAITCFQHDGIKIVSGSEHGLKMWDVQTGEFIRDLLFDLSGVWQVKFDERRCVAAIQRNNQTYIEVLDFGASRDGVPASKRGRRILVDAHGDEIHEPRDPTLDAEGEIEADDDDTNGDAEDP